MLTTEEFIAKANKKHGSKYDYSQTVFKDWDTHVLIVCRVHVHDEISMMPAKHIYGRGQGCKKCGQVAWGKEKNQRASMDFMRKAQAIHGDKYDYSLALYVSAISVSYSL